MKPFLKLSVLAPTGAPEITSYSTTPTSINVSWTAVQCIERNGMITHYQITLSLLNEENNSTYTDLTERTYTATNLTPGTSYLFEVAAVNSDGMGPSSNRNISTMEEGIIIIAVVVLQKHLRPLQLIFLCVIHLTH